MADLATPMQAPKKVHSPPPSPFWPGLPGLLCLPLLTRPLFRLSPVPLPLVLLLLRPKAKLIFLIARKRPARGRCATLRSGTPTASTTPPGPQTASRGQPGGIRRLTARVRETPSPSWPRVRLGSRGPRPFSCPRGDYGCRGHGGI